jgi:hypothetical protein
MKKEFLIFKAFQKDWRMLSLASLISFGFVGVIHSCDKSPEPAANEGIDTMIPAGYVIIPIEVQNFESLDSLLGKYGVGDLFKGDGKNGKLVARNIRILRAPKNPSHFAVLAPESQASSILSNQGNFYVALKGPHQSATQIVSEHEGKNVRRIHFDGD